MACIFILSYLYYFIVPSDITNGSFLNIFPQILQLFSNSLSVLVRCVTVIILLHVLVFDIWGRSGVKPSQRSQLNTHFRHFLHAPSFVISLSPDSLIFLIQPSPFHLFFLAFLWSYPGVGWDPCRYRSLSSPKNFLPPFNSSYSPYFLLYWSSFKDVSGAPDTTLFLPEKLIRVFSFAPNSWIMYQTLHALWLRDGVYALLLVSPMPPFVYSLHVPLWCAHTAHYLLLFSLHRKGTAGS